MINYSLAARRNPQDSESTEKYYAQAQYKEKLDLSTFAKHITSHGCVYSYADILAILEMACECARENLLAGNAICMGSLGSFWITLSSKGADSAAEFTADNITAIKGKWTPGTAFKNLIKDAEFNQVLTRKLNSTVISAVANGKTSVTI